MDANRYLRIRIHAYSFVDTLDEWPNLKAWKERIAARSAAQKGIDVPVENFEQGLQK